VGQTRERVVLVHELRQLRRAEELLDRRDDGADVDQGLRRDRLDVLRGHALADDALHADRPVRTWFWMSSPTARMRRLPKLSMSSTSRRISAGWPLRMPGWSRRRCAGRRGT
jgi:hypothetical protein